MKSEEILMPEQEIVIFEDITLSNLSLFKRFVKQGAQIEIFDFDFQIKQKRYLKPFLDAGQLQRIYINPFSSAHGLAIDLAEKFLGFIQASAPYQAASLLYGSEDVSFLFRRGFAQEIFKFCYIHDYLEKLSASSRPKDIVFVSKQYVLMREFLQREIGHNKPLPAGINIRRDFFEHTRELKDKVVFKAASMAYVLLRGAGCLAGAISLRAFVKKECRDYAVLVGSRLEVERVADRGYDFFIDGERFKNENTVFLDNSGLQEDLLKRERARGRWFLGIKKNLKFLYLIKHRWDMAFLGRSTGSLGCVFLSWKAPALMWRVYFICIQKYCDWNLILQQVDFKDLIYTNQENIQMSAANILLKQRGKHSWNYSCFLGGSYFIAKNKDIRSVRHVLWSFLVYDYFVGFNRDVIEYYKIHYQQVKEYYAVGSLYAQLIRRHMNNDGRHVLFTKNFPRISDFKNKKVIAVFDTTFIDAQDCLTNIEDGLLFYEDMLNLLLENENYLMVFKPSKSPTFYCDPKHPGSSLKGEVIIKRWHELFGFFI